jgi:cytochrome bd-type quinol oxidase subunit 2
MKSKILPIVLLVATVVLAVVSFLLLPDTVITQIGGNRNSTMSRPMAVLLPSLLGVIPSLLVLFGKEDERRKTYLILSGAGVLVFIVMLLVNLL